MPRSICITGAPGAGKTTIAKAVASRLDLLHYSTGDLARRLAEDDLRVKKALDAGQVAPPDIMDRTLAEKLQQGGMVLDGYPRYLSQFHEATYTGAMIVIVTLTREEATQRLRNRHRSDYDAMREMARLDYYKEKILPLTFELRRSQGLVVDGGNALMHTIRQIENHWYSTGGQKDVKVG